MGECIDACINAGLEMLKVNYKVVPIEQEKFGVFRIQAMDYRVSQYEVKEVGNLLVMSSKNSETMQMMSFVLTPYFKNLPLFSTDYMCMKENGCFINEIYRLVSKEDECYKRYIEKFTENIEKHNQLSDMPVKPSWYDSLRSVSMAKATTPANEQEILEVFTENLSTFIAMEKEMPILTEEEYQIKWQKTQKYVEELVANGGVSTDVFKAILGPEKTKEFFETVFFASSRYKK
ncbi:MAG: bilin reductase [bacterium]|nr:bilin reductase [bacterium]